MTQLKQNAGTCLLLTSLSLAVMASGCRQPSSDSHDAQESGHGHGRAAHAEKSAGFTVWEDQYEIFGEHRLPVAGRPVTLVMHVTDMRHGSPRQKGPIRLVMRSKAGRSQDHKESKPSRTGIYLPEVTFPTAGKWEVTLHIPTEGRQCKISLPPIRVFSDHEAVHQASVKPPPDGLAFLKEQQWKVGLLTEEVEARSLVEHLEVSAEVKPKPGSIGKVTSPVAGMFVPPGREVLPKLGQQVERGMTLARVRPIASEMAQQVVEAEANVKRSKLELEQARRSLKRVKRLAKVEAKSERELEVARFELESAKSKYEAARAVQRAYEQLGTSESDKEASADASVPRGPSIALKAPITGTVIEQPDTALGEYLPEKRSLYTILDAETVRIKGHIPEAKIGEIGAPQRAYYEVPGVSQEPHFIGGDHPGKLVHLGERVDSTTRTTPIIYEVKNERGRLRPGQAVTLHVGVGEEAETPAIPASAIIQIGQQPAAFVQLGGETFEKRFLKLGIREGSYVEVRSGLRVGERVVTKGAYLVRLAETSSGLPSHGHSH